MRKIVFWFLLWKENSFFNDGIQFKLNLINKTSQEINEYVNFAFEWSITKDFWNLSDEHQAKKQNCFARKSSNGKSYLVLFVLSFISLLTSCFEDFCYVPKFGRTITIHWKFRWDLAEKSLKLRQTFWNWKIFNVFQLSFNGRSFSSLVVHVRIFWIFFFFFSGPNDGRFRRRNLFWSFIFLPTEINHVPSLRNWKKKISLKTKRNSNACLEWKKKEQRVQFSHKNNEWIYGNHFKLISSWLEEDLWIFNNFSSNFPLLKNNENNKITKIK